MLEGKEGLLEGWCLKDGELRGRFKSVVFCSPISVWLPQCVNFFQNGPPNRVKYRLFPIISAVECQL